MARFEMVKVFDLSQAPTELRDADDFALLRPGPTAEGTPILTLRVGQYTSPIDGPINDCITRAITLAEYQLHRWLTEWGAEEGEAVLLRWKGCSDW